VQPVGGQLADFSERRKDIGIEDLGPVRLVEALDEGIQRRLARLDLAEANAAGVTPSGEFERGQLPTVVEPQVLRWAMERDQLLQHGDDPKARHVVPISIARPSRLLASIRLSVRKRRPS
jgi:hypothetical protein